MLFREMKLGKNIELSNSITITFTMDLKEIYAHTFHSKFREINDVTKGITK